MAKQKVHKGSLNDFSDYLAYNYATEDDEMSFVQSKNYKREKKEVKKQKKKNKKVKKKKNIFHFEDNYSYNKSSVIEDLGKNKVVNSVVNFYEKHKVAINAVVDVGLIAVGYFTNKSKGKSKKRNTISDVLYSVLNGYSTSKATV